MERGGTNQRLSLIVVVAVVALVVVAVMAVTMFGVRTPVDKAIVHASDGTVQELPLSQDAVVAVAMDKGTNEVEVKGGQVRVRDADCPNHDCVDQGWISCAGQQIVCLPHELWIEIVADESTDGAETSAGFDTVGR